jgi:hypothetical protein
MLRQGDRAAIARCDPRFRIVSSKRTTRQVEQAPHTEVFGELPQLRAARSKETAQQPIPADVRFLKTWFRDTLSDALIERLA